MELIQLYKGQLTHDVFICGLKRKLPIRKVDDEVWIASDHELILGDVEFIEEVARELARKISGYKVDVTVTAEAKAQSLCYEVTKKLGLRNFVVCRKSLKSYMKNPVSVELKSITTKEKQKLILDEVDAEKLKGRNVALIDDVVTTGGNMNAMEKLVSRVGGKTCVKACIWVEGPAINRDSWKARENLVFLGYLPIFYGKKKYEAMKKLLGRTKNERTLSDSSLSSTA